MRPYYAGAGIDLYVGDARDVLRELPSESVQCCVTSPPFYGLRSYGGAAQVWGGDADCPHAWQADRYYVNGGAAATSGAIEAFSDAGEANAARVKAARWREDSYCQHCGAWCGDLGLERTPQEFIQHLVDVFREVHRVLRNDGVLWLEIGSSYAGAGYSNHANTGGAQREDGGKQHHTQAFRPGNPDKNGGVSNRDRLGSIPGFKPKDLIPIPWMLGMALQQGGWWLRADVIWNRPNPMPEAVTDRPTKSHSYVLLLTKSERYTYNAEGIREPNSSTWQLEHNRRYAKPYAKYDQRAPTTGQPGNVNNVGIHARGARDGRNKRSVWEIQSEPNTEEHYALMPSKLAKLCILAGSNEGDTVLDPFAGLATTLRAAQALGRRGLGIELNPTYADLAIRRLLQPAMALES